MKLPALVLTAALLVSPALAQHEHHMQHKQSDVKLTLSEDAANHRITMRLGPLNLPAHSDHMAVAQPKDEFFEVPFDGWLTAYHPALLDAKGAAIADKLLHHVAFWNTNRSDFLCRNKEEHIFGAGGEMNDWPALAGFGYRVRKGDKIRVSTMFHNPSANDHPEVFLQVQMEYQRAEEQPPRKSVYPAWFDVMECGDSGYDLRPGRSTTNGTVKVLFNGLLLGAGGHLHDYGERLDLFNATRNEPVVQLKADLDAEGHIRSMPIAIFLERGGYPLAAGEFYKTTATYNNLTGTELMQGAMGIVVGYFLPQDDRAMEVLRREKKSVGLGDRP